MTSTDFQAISPLIAVGTGAVVVMAAIAGRRSHPLAFGLTLASLLAALLCLPVAHAAAPHAVGVLLTIDPFGLYYIGLLLAAAAAVTVLAHGYLDGCCEQPEEFHVLLLLATLGSLVLATATHFVSFFLGLELLSVSLYGMIGYTYGNARALEAAVKYLFPAAATSAFLLFGLALVYARSGTMQFAELAAWAQGVAGMDAYLLAGAGMILVGIGFKLSLVPFHQWTPDTYEGAPAPVAAFLATVAKGGMVVLLARLFAAAGPLWQPPLQLTLIVLAAASMTAGNLLALRQSNIKRLLAYSSIAHMGYLMVAFLAGGALGLEAVTLYLSVYFIAALGAFGVISYLSTGGQEAEAIDAYRGLFWSRPWPAAALTVGVASLIGLPLTAGFIGKLFIFIAGIDAGLWFLVLWLALNSAVGLYYYLRIVMAMYGDAGGAAADQGTQPARASALVLGALTLLAVWLGVYPAPLLQWIEFIVGTP
jgi:NADH-quinone oxidoreductase subunit N